MKTLYLLTGKSPLCLTGKAPLLLENNSGQKR